FLTQKIVDHHKGDRKQVLDARNGFLGEDKLFAQRLFENVCLLLVCLSFCFLAVTVTPAPNHPRHSKTNRVAAVTKCISFPFGTAPRWLEAASLCDECLFLS